MNAERSPADGGGRSVDVALLLVVAAIAFAPFIQFIASNRFEALDEIPVLALGAVFAGLATIAAAVVSLRVGATETAAGAVVFLVLFFAFRPFDERFAAPGALLVWGALTAAAVIIAMRVARRATMARSFLLIVGGVLIVMSLLPLVVATSPASSARSGTDAATSTTPFVTEGGEKRPNVYLFLLDAYARADQLEAKLGYDNSPTIDGLRDRGFDVADDATSAYLFTPASVASLLQADYPIRSSEDLALGLDRFGPVMSGDNRTVATFRSLGYEYWYAEPGVFAPMACHPSAEVHCLPVNAARPTLGDAGVLIGTSTPLGLLDTFDPPHDLPDPLDVTELLLKAPTEGPRFVYAHILSPHNPFRVHADCSPLDEPIDDLGPRSGALGAAYAEQLTCLNTKLLESLDQIVAADPGAIIAVVSDHGDWFTEAFPGPDADPAVLAERFDTLMALRTPDCTTTEAPKLLTGLFPTIFSCIRGIDVPLPEDHHFYVDYAGRFAEVDDEFRRLP